MTDKKLFIKLSLLFFAIIGLPAIQTLTRILPETRLIGAVTEKPLPQLTWNNWYHFQYQPDLNHFIERNFGFRTSFVKLYNQFEYSLFGQSIPAETVLNPDADLADLMNLFFPPVQPKLFYPEVISQDAYSFNLPTKTPIWLS